MKYSRVFRKYSDDDGATWSDPEEITETFNRFHNDYDWKVCATGPGHGIQLNNGRMIIPVWLSDGSGTEMGKGHLGHRPSIILLFIATIMVLLGKEEILFVAMMIILMVLFLSIQVKLSLFN